MLEPAVALSEVHHRYGDVVALRGVTLAVPAGLRYGLLGPNGSGKTTLFRILATLLTPTEGTARVFGHDVQTDSDSVRRRLGVVFQRAALDDALTVRENLRFQAALYGLTGAARDARIDALLDAFGLADRRDDRVDTLSGGLARRTDLARGLLHRPDLLLLDEPTSGLDPIARHAFWQALDGLRREEGTTVIVATHLLDEADACDRVGILDTGRLVADDAPEALKAPLGGETLWLGTPDPAALQAHIEARFGVEARVVGEAVQLTHAEAPALLSSLYEAFGDEIASATIRKPTLEDAFLLYTGHAFEAATVPSI